MIASTAFFNLSEQLRILGKFCFEEGVGLDKFITLSHSQVEVQLQLIVGGYLALGFSHLLCTFLAKLVVMGSQQGHLFKQDVVFLS